MNSKRIFVKSYGCSANQADGEVLSGCLAEAGFKIVPSDSEADVLIYNCCAVKGPTEDRMFEVLKRAPREKQLIVAGCLPLICHDRLRREVIFDGAVGSSLGVRIVDVVSRVLRGERVVALDIPVENKPGLLLPRVRSSPVISIVPVSYGCLGSCAYCCVVFARGRLRSYTPEEILTRIRADLTSGTREFWLTSQDTGCYGKDICTNLANLLETICELPEDFRIRVGMMTPNFARSMLADLVDAYRNPKVFKFLHLPVQSGDNTVLMRMRRGYKVEDFREIVETFRVNFPIIALATDVICGFPGETPEAFNKTVRLIGDLEPDVVNISKFFPRPGTAAAEMLDAVDPAEIKLRSLEMSKLVKRISLRKNQSWTGWVGEVLVDEKGKTRGSWIGRNFAYKPVVIQSSQNLLGKVICVKIVEICSTYLAAEIL
ncbi:TPA: tRNA (N(6)-L-threonylcarbamoyladenosine(37)-C(2))-methylthiotransferase [Candidatus Bathyarchaeota archaeon]|nr:tRNA (N(6)-L-threonylcarbamoyladenosine(37)-C(2))-methylthiotransferase [Candidatus Bathyarchaeota archaeon]